MLYFVSFVILHIQFFVFKDNLVAIILMIRIYF